MRPSLSKQPARGLQRRGLVHTMNTNSGEVWQLMIPLACNEGTRSRLAKQNIQDCTSVHAQHSIGRRHSRVHTPNRCTEPPTGPKESHSQRLDMGALIHPKGWETLREACSESRTRSTNAIQALWQCRDCSVCSKQQPLTMNKQKWGPEPALPSVGL